MAAPAAEGENLIQEDGDFVGEEPQAFTLTADGIWMWFGQSYFRVFCLVFSVILFLNLMRYLADVLARMEGDAPVQRSEAEGESQEELEERMRRAREKMQEKHKGDAQAYAEELARQEAEKREERIRSMEAKEAARRGETVPGRPSGHSPDYRPNPAFGGGGGGSNYRPRPRRPPGGYGGG